MIHIKSLRSPLTHFVSPDDLFGEPRMCHSVVSILIGKGYGIVSVLINKLVWSPIAFKAYLVMGHPDVNKILL